MQAALPTASRLSLMLRQIVPSAERCFTKATLKRPNPCYVFVSPEVSLHISSGPKALGTSLEFASVFLDMLLPFMFPMQRSA